MMSSNQNKYTHSYQINFMLVQFINQEQALINDTDKCIYVRTSLPCAHCIH